MSAAEILLSPPPAFSEPDVAELAGKHFGLSVTATALVSERDQNFKLQSNDGELYLLKIANAAENAEAIRFENAALAHLKRVTPEIPVPRVLASVDGERMVAVRRDKETHWLRVISWMPGIALFDVEASEALRRQLGSSLANLGLALRGFFHPGAGKQLLWDIRHTAELSHWLEHVENPETRNRCKDVVVRFGSKILPRLECLRSQVIHNDLNAGNVLVSDEPHPAVTGIIDFGDMIHGPLVCDVAIGAAYQLTSDPDPLVGAVQFVEAYHRVNPLEADEIELLFDLICARLVTTLIIASWRASRFPDNREYILSDVQAAGSKLQFLTALGVEKGTNRLARACTRGTIPVPMETADDLDALLGRRKKLLGPAYRLFYERPVHVVRGEGVWLYDATGKAYLDAYNNVPLVGHSHPKVVQALSRQAATLNTHTRYLNHTVLDYAEQLLALFSSDLDRVMFSCTGSEANELALRIARSYTGNEGVIVSENAYHGNTTAIAQLSPCYRSPAGLENWVETVPPPDTYRCQSGSEEEAVTNEFLADVDSAIDRLASRGIRPAALLLDTAFTSDGTFVAPKACLAAAVERVRQAGGVFIADEVQAGFGRLGEALWGFDVHDIEPEIVTLGKPIGNGHPLAATVVRHGILDVFSKRERYFNTFGGNPVSAAVGKAVLEVFKDNALANNSRDVGAYLHGRLADLKSEFEIIGDVRGSGLLAGVELVEDRATKQHAPGKAAEVVNDLRDHGVLISTEGPKDNVLKIRPPLPFRKEHVDLLIATLQESLKQTARQK